MGSSSSPADRRPCDNHRQSSASPPSSPRAAFQPRSHNTDILVEVVWRFSKGLSCAAFGLVMPFLARRHYRRAQHTIGTVPRLVKYRTGQIQENKIYKTGHIQGTLYTRHVKYKTGHLLDWSYTGHVIYRTGHIQDTLYTRLLINKTGHIQDTSYTSLVIYKTRHMQNWL